MPLGTPGIVLLFIVAIVIFGSTWLPQLGDWLARAIAHWTDDEQRRANVEDEQAPLEWARLRFAAGLLVALAAFAGIAAVPLGREGPWPLVPVAIAFAIIAAATMTLVTTALIAELEVVRLLRRAGQLPLQTDGRALSEGATLRVSGLVERLDTTSTEAVGKPVLKEYSVRSAFGDPMDERSQAHDFVIRLADGERIGVLAEEAARQGALRIACRQLQLTTSSPRGWGREGWIAAGDVIEVVGRMTQAIDRQSPARRPRELPRGWEMIVPGEGPMIVINRRG